jgi:hypothetical protein
MKMKTDQKSLMTTAGVCFFVGIGLWLFAQKIMCIPLSNQCYLVTSGDSIFNAQGPQINSTVATTSAPASYLFLGIGSISLLAGLIKTEDKSK